MERILISIGDDPDFEDLVADIEIGPYYIGSITQDEGFDKLNIHIPIGVTMPMKEHIKDLPTFTLQELEEAIRKAKQRLWDLRKIEPSGSGDNEQ